MAPKNKRTLLYVVEALPLFVMKADSAVWKGDRALQRKFEEALENTGLKKSGKPYDSNSGGARTYASQLVALGLLFYDDSSSPHQYRLTLAGEAILKGSNPLAILQNQLLKFQYPSVYSMSRGVDLLPDFKIRPFLFILKMLLDEDVKCLSKEEVGRFIISYAKTASDYEKVKRMILDYRQDPEAYVLPESFMKDTVSPRTKKHTFEDRIIYLEDKANIFFNYLDSVQLVVRPDSRNIIQVNEEYAEKIKLFIEDNKPLLPDLENKLSFQRRFGLDLERRKDTRSFNGATVSQEVIKESLVKNKFFAIAKNRLILGLDSEIVEKIHSETGVAEKDVVKFLDKLSVHGLTYFEEKYLEMSVNGRDECIDFEIATQQIFEKQLKFEAKHIGQVKPKTRTGGNPDIIFLSSEEKCCGIVDSKAYKKYSISNDHKNRMLNDYIPNYSEHAKSLPLKAFLYVSGGFSRGFENALKDLSEKANIEGAGISAKNLLRLSRRVKEKDIRHKKLLGVFSSNQEIDAITIDAL